MTYYGDLECPICRDFTVSGGFPQLVANEVRQGKVKVVYRAFETATPDPTTFQTQQVAALAAGKQNHFWDFTELFYHQQGQEADGLRHRGLPERPRRPGAGAERLGLEERPQRSGARRAGDRRRRRR